MQLKASAVPLNLTRDLQKTAIQSLQGDLESTQDSLNNWDEVNLKSIQGVCVDESVATSTSSVSRTTEPAITHSLKHQLEQFYHSKKKHDGAGLGGTLGPSAPDILQMRVTQMNFTTIPCGPVSELFFLMRRETHPMDWVPSSPSPSRKACSFPLGKTL